MLDSILDIDTVSKLWLEHGKVVENKTKVYVKAVFYCLYSYFV